MLSNAVTDFVVKVYVGPWASEEFFQLGDFSQIFLGRGQSGGICFFSLEIKKTTSFAKTFKIQGSLQPPGPPSDTHV